MLVDVIAIWIFFPWNVKLKDRGVDKLIIITN